MKPENLLLPSGPSAWALRSPPPLMSPTATYAPPDPAPSQVPRRTLRTRRRPRGPRGGLTWAAAAALGGSDRRKGLEAWSERSHPARPGSLSASPRRRGSQRPRVRRGSPRERRSLRGRPLPLPGINLGDRKYNKTSPC